MTAWLHDSMLTHADSVLLTEADSMLTDVDRMTDLVPPQLEDVLFVARLLRGLDTAAVEVGVEGVGELLQDVHVDILAGREVI